MESFLKLKSHEKIKLYSNIINELVEENFIEDSSDIIYPSSDKLIIKYFLDLDINRKIVFQKISEHFKLPLIRAKEVSVDYLITDLGVIYEGVFYLLNPFSNTSKKVIFENMEYKFFEDIGLISENEYNVLVNLVKNEKSDLGSIYFLNEIVDTAIQNNVTEIYIPLEGEESDIFFKYNNNSYKHSKKYSYDDFPIINGVQIFMGRDYYVETKKIDSGDKVLCFIYINLYRDVSAIDDIEPKYNLKIKELLGISNGLFLISEKNDNGVYYSLLDSLSKETSKKIVSIEENVKSKINNVFQVSNFSELDFSLFDIICIKNVKKQEEIKILLEGLKAGKLVIISMISQDSLTAVLSLISDFNIDRNLLAEKLIAVYHSTLLPKVCSECSIDYEIGQSSIIREEHFKAYKMSMDAKSIVKKSNHNGCSNCNSGYEGGIFVSELLDNDKDVSKQIENDFNIRELRSLKQSKRWDTIHVYGKLLVERNILTLEDIKNIL